MATKKLSIRKKKSEPSESKFERISLEVLVPNRENSRVHSHEQIQQIAASIQEFGFTNPILVDEGNGVLAGHGRLQAARSLGMDLVPCIRLVGLTEEQKRAYVVVDNKLPLNAEWDKEVLAGSLAYLQAKSFNLAITGFNEDELRKLLAQPTSLAEKKLELKPMKKTHILISIRNTELRKISKHLDDIVALGCAEVDYSGN